ncbi:hypothetical protein IW262DRAFT_1389662 [Armillaria fumosa]|nr:hypothetical protein IW262DRAFT_1389662 [Armillaria fumosa]
MTIFYFRCLLTLLLLLSMAQTRAAQGNDDVSNVSNGRTTWDIVWNCLATIFACTWLAVHPNVPSRYIREKGRLFLGLHRVKHALLAIICPEAIIMWAFRQRLVASELSKHLKLSMTHGFFVSMGGFVGKDDYLLTAADFFVRPYVLFDCVIRRKIRSDLDLSPILRIPKEELMDKSKGDALSKSISLLQTTWFVVQYFSRITLSLPTTPLETATLAFALLNFCNYILWWHKPLDVQHPLNVPTFNTVGLEPRTVFSDSTPTSSRVFTTDCSHVPTSPSSTSTFTHQLPADCVKTHASESVCCSECFECDISNPLAMSINDWRFFYQDAGLITCDLSRCRGSDEWSVFQTSANNIDILPTVAIVSPRATGMTLVTESDEPQRRHRLWLHEILFILIPSLCVRGWRRYRYILARILWGSRNGSRIPNATLPMLWAGQLSWNQMSYTALFGAFPGALFGGLHCIAWSSSGFFASPLEHLLWKISSLLVAIIPILLAFEILTLGKLSWIPVFVHHTTPIFIFVYICARAYLLVDMFVSLRSLPAGALEEIDWTRYIPHI